MNQFNLKFKLKEVLVLKSKSHFKNGLLALKNAINKIDCRNLSFLYQSSLNRFSGIIFSFTH